MLIHKTHLHKHYLILLVSKGWYHTKKNIAEKFKVCMLNKMSTHFKCEKLFICVCVPFDLNYFGTLYMVRTYSVKWMRIIKMMSWIHTYTVIHILNEQTGIASKSLRFMILSTCILPKIFASYYMYLHGIIIAHSTFM